MIEISVLSLFAVALVFCIGFDISILIALVFGFFLFFGYGLFRKHSVKEMAAMAFSGIKTVKNILITFLLCCLISALTGTAFGTAATMGVICTTMAGSMGIPILYSGGAMPTVW